MRLFLGIDLPSETREFLVKVRNHLEGEEYRHIGDNLVSWVAPANWHVTLKFLGDVDGLKLAELIESLRQVEVSLMTLIPEQMVYFPNRGPVHVVAVETLDRSG